MYFTMPGAFGNGLTMSTPHWLKGHGLEILVRGVGGSLGPGSTFCILHTSLLALMCPGIWLASRCPSGVPYLLGPLLLHVHLLRQSVFHGVLPCPLFPPHTLAKETWIIFSIFRIWLHITVHWIILSWLPHDRLEEYHDVDIQLAVSSTCVWPVLVNLPITHRCFFL